MTTSEYVLGMALGTLFLRALSFAARQLWLALGAETRHRQEEQALARRLQMASPSRRSTGR